MNKMNENITICRREHKKEQQNLAPYLCSVCGGEQVGGASLEHFFQLAKHRLLRCEKERVRKYYFKIDR